jgi:hypothetical protein
MFGNDGGFRRHWEFIPVDGKKKSQYFELRQLSENLAK